MRNITSRVIALTTTILFAFLLPLSASSETFTVGVEDIEYYPIYAKRDGTYSGYARAVLDEFAKQSGHKFTYQALPIKRLFNSFLSGELDFKFPDSPYWQKDMKEGKNVKYSDSIIEYVDGVMVAPANIGKGKGSIKKLGVLRGFTAWDYLGDIENKSIELTEVTSLEALVKMTKGGRLDGVYFNVIVANHFLAETMFDKGGILFDESLPHTRGNYYLSSIKHPEMIDQFNEFLRTNQSLIASLKTKYGVNLF